MHSRRPSPALILAGLALFIALSGSALAAGHFIITSTRQIKPSVLRSLHGEHGARGPQGPAGAQGPTGSTGAQGPPGPVNLSALRIVRAPDLLVAPQTEASSVATCPSGSRVVSGGAWTGLAFVIYSEMSDDHQSWITLVFNNNTKESKTETNLEAIAYCAATSGAVAASAPGAAHARAVREAQALRARFGRERASL